MRKNSENLKRILLICEYLQKLEEPAGIIHNLSNQVIWRNIASQKLQQKWYRQFPKFEIIKNTTDLQNPLNLKILKKQIKQLTPIKALPSFDYLEKEYDLFFRGIGTVTVRDRFYRLKYFCEDYRIFENLKTSIPLGKPSAIFDSGFSKLSKNNTPQIYLDRQI